MRVTQRVICFLSIVVLSGCSYEQQKCVKVIDERSSFLKGVRVDYLGMKYKADSHGVSPDGICSKFIGYTNEKGEVCIKKDITNNMICSEAKYLFFKKGYKIEKYDFKNMPKKVILIKIKNSKPISNR